MTGVSRGGYQQSAVQSQKAVSAHLTSEQILPFGFAKEILVVSQETRGIDPMLA